MGDVVHIDGALREALDAFVVAGHFASREDVIREAVRMMQRGQALDAILATGLDDLDSGRFDDAEIVFDRLEQKYADLAAKAAA